MKFSTVFFLLVLLPLFPRSQSSFPVAQTKDSPTILRSGPSDNYDRIVEAPKGLRFAVESREKGWSKIRLSKNLSGWTETKSLESLPPGALPSHPVLTRVKIKVEKGDVRMEIQESEPGAVVAEEWIHPRVLWLKFENAASALWEIDYAPGDPIIDHVSVWQEADDLAVMKIDLKANYGYRMIQKDPEHLLVKFKLKPLSAGLSGWTVCIDPGHGGKDTGAIGPTGLMEKNIALSISKTLGKMLASKGAVVVYTRAADASMADPSAPEIDELEDRVKIARERGANLFVSVHCNARPTVAQGRVARGSYVYYYDPHSYALAGDVSRDLERQIEEPKYGIIFRSLHVIRETDFPAILVETVFISNPVIEARLRRPAYLKRIAQGIFEGILAYAHSLQ